MKDLINKILNGKKPALNEFVEAFSYNLELLSHLESTVQDPDWHGEGNVLIHTQFVLNEVYKMLDTIAIHLPSEDKLSLILAAVLHDIGKPLVTKTKEIDGVPRIVAPYHEGRGCSYLAYRLLEINLPYNVVQQTLRLVAYHHKPKRLVLHNALKNDYFHLARLVNTELLFYLAKADMLGRKCKDQNVQCDYIDLFRIFCEEYNLWGNKNPYDDWRIFFNNELAHLSDESRDAVFGYAVQDFEQGLIFTPEEAIARRYPYLKFFPQLMIMCGPSGSGKSTWIQKNLKDYHKISLDDLRQEHCKSRGNQKDNSFIMVKAKEQLKIHLRKHEKVVWDATNLRKDFRSMICQFGYDYHALVTLIVLHIPESQIFKGNNSRDHQVPKEVIHSQIETLQWVDDAEAHRVAFVNHENSLDFRGFCNSSDEQKERCVSI
ncbi:MAG: AAA family ATPase [Parachlamydiaceae bacterium]|nr:AAA family ATPase [Parachlamydiaceae bacterium]